MDRRDVSHREDERADTYEDAVGMEDVRRWLQLLQRQWFVILSVFCLVIVAVAVAAAQWPWKYESQAKFLVRNARQELVVTPNDKSGGMLRQDVSEETLNSEIELIRSRDILEKVVKESNLVRSTGREDPSAATERAINALQAQLTVAPIRKTNLIHVSYRSRDPLLAAAVLRRVADAYLSLHLAVHSSPGTYLLFTEQATRWREQLLQAEAALATLAGSRNLVAPEEQRNGALQSGRDMEEELVAVEAQVLEQTTRMRGAERALSTTEPRIVTQKRRIPNQGSVERAHTMLAELKNKRTELLTKFNADDRLVAEVEQQLANTEQALRDATTMTATEEASDVNPSWLSLQNERMNASLALAGLASRADRLRAQVSAYRARAVGLAEASPQYETLLRQAAEARDQYSTYQRRAEEARLAEALDRQRISNVVLAEAPVAAQVPDRPGLALVLLIGGIAGGVAGLMIGVVADWRGAPARRAVAASYPSILSPDADVRQA